MKSGIKPQILPIDSRDNLVYNKSVMRKEQLTKTEQKENVFKTLGRLKTAIKEGSRERQLALYEKLSKDISDMDINSLLIK